MRRFLVSGICGLSLLLVGSVSTWADDTDNMPKSSIDYLNGLKTYRTYYFTQILAPQGHQFVVWVNDTNPEKGWQDYNATIASADAASTLTVSDLRSTGVIYAGYPEPPQTLSVPDSLSDLKTKAIAQITRLFPNAKEIRLGYLGDYGSLRVRELIPIAPPKEGFIRSGISAVADFSVSADGNVKLVGRSGNRVGFGLLGFHDNFPQMGLLDFSLPAEIEGSSIATLETLKDSTATDAHRKAYTDLLSQIAKFPLDGSSLGSTNSTMRELIERQGDELLPAALRQRLQLKVQVSGPRPTGPGAIDPGDYAKLNIPVDTLFQNRKVDIESQTRLGITLHLTGELVDANVNCPESCATFSLIATDSKGASGSAAFNLSLKNVVSNPGPLTNRAYAVLGSVALIPAAGAKQQYGGVLIQIGADPAASSRIRVESTVYPAFLTGTTAARGN